MQKTIFSTFIGLFLMTIIVFQVVYLVFRTDEYFQFGNNQFLYATSISCAAVLTLIYSVTAAANMISLSRKNKLSFGKVFKLTFLPGFLAGMASFAAIFAFYYYLDPESIEQLKQQYFNVSLENAKGGEQYEEIEKLIKSKEVQETSLLTWRTFTLGVFFITCFNFSLALMLSLMWKIRNTK